MPKRRTLRWLLRFVIGLLILLLISGGYLWWSYHGPQGETEIYRGIFYSCLRVPQGPQSGGLLHLVRADLNAPGVNFYITPLDRADAASGWEYRLRLVPGVVREQNLAAAVNATLFKLEPQVLGFPGDRADGSETLVVDHVVNHVDPNTYLLWWDDQLMAHLEISKPPSADVLRQAKWAVGGQMALLIDGKVNMWAGLAPDHRTMIAADPQRRLVWLACFDRASYKFAAQTLADLGAKIGVMVDGGNSTSMAIGKDSRGVRSGRVVGWRPVANVFGFRADPM